MTNSRFTWSMAVGLLMAVLPGCSRQKQMEQAVVSGPSMGSIFPGEHRKANCPECNYPVVCDADNGPDSGKAFCPMCGGMELDWSSMPRFSGVQCEIETTARRPERWDVVAIELPTTEQDQRFGIKRVIGLPGERLSFRGGNLNIDGAIVRKSIPQQRLLWQPVFDSTYLPGTEGILNRFVPVSTVEGAGNGSWTGSGSRLIFAAEPPSVEWQELAYLHRASFPVPAAMHTDSNCLILDHYFYNQGVSSTMLPVADLAMEMIVGGEVESEIELVFQVRDSFRVTVGLRMEAGNKLSVSVGDLAKERISFSRTGRSVSLLVSVIDECCIVEINGQTVFEKPFSEFLEDEIQNDIVGTIPLPQLLIRARGGTLNIDALRIWRDTMLVWGDPFDGPVDEGREVRIPAEKYFVIGDNLPVSRDSRNWPNVFVPEANILGTVRKPD